MGQPRPYCKGAGSQRSPILRVLLYLCLYSLTQNDQFGMITNVGRGVFLGGQARRCVRTNALRGLSAIAEFLAVIVI